MHIASTPLTPDLVLIFHPNSKNTLFLLFPSSPSARSPKLRENSTLEFLCLEGSTFYQQATMFFFPRVKGCLAICGKFISFFDFLTLYPQANALSNLSCMGHTVDRPDLQRAQRTKLSRPGGPLAKSRGPKSPKTSSHSDYCDQDF